MLRQESHTYTCKHGFYPRTFSFGKKPEDRDPIVASGCIWRCPIWGHAWLEASVLFLPAITALKWRFSATPCSLSLHQGAADCALVSRHGNKKGWSGDGKTAGQRWIQEDTLDPIDGCQVVHRDGNKDERVNITFSLLFRPYLGFHWEPEAFVSDYTFKKRLSAHQQTDRCVKWPSSEPSEAEVSFSLCFFCTKYRKITRCGLRRSSQRRPRCPEPLHVWSVSTLLLKPSDLLAWPRSGHPAGAEWTSLFFKAFLFFQEWSCSWKKPRRKRPPSVSVSEQYNEGEESEAPRVCVCLCVCSRDFFHVFVWNVSVWFVQSEGAWVDVLLPVRIIAHVHWCLGFVWFDGWLLSCSCFWGFGEGWSWKKRPDQQETQLCYGLNKRQEGVLCVCVFSLNKNPPGNLLLPIKKEPKHLSHPTVSLISSVRLHVYTVLSSVRRDRREFKPGPLILLTVLLI